MPMKKSIYKIPGGKLVKIFLDEHEGVVTSIKITGDFFLHPEEAIEALEQVLVGVELNEGMIGSAIDRFLAENKVTCFGVDTEGLAKAIMMCVGGG
jgi:lipoate---protein ligase